MRLSAKVDYAVRAALELAAADASLSTERIADAQGIPNRFLGNILGDMRRAGLVRSRRGAEGGFQLARPAEEIMVADVIRATQGSLAEVHGEYPEETDYEGAASSLRDVWIAARASYRRVLEQVSLADVVAGTLPPSVAELLDEPGAWRARLRD